MPRRRGGLRSALILLAALALTLGGPATAQEPPDRDRSGTLGAAGVQGGIRDTRVPSVQVTFLDVGQGDAVVIRTPEGRTAMIDAGPGSPLRYLQRMGVDSLDLLVATHPHADHIGGIEDVLTARPVHFFMDNGQPHTTATYESLMRTLERLESVTYLEATPRMITLGSATLEVLPLPPPDVDLNDRSVGLVLRFGAFVAFLSGDSERFELDSWARAGVVPDVTLLKAPHHGSVNGFTRAFLAAARPELVVISVGADNTYGHPRPEAVTAYASWAEQVLRTDQAGHITVLGYQDGSYEVVAGRTLPSETSVGGGGDPVPAEEPGSEPAPVGLVMSVVADAPGNDHAHLNGEFVTIANPGAGDVEVSGWRLCDLSTRCFRFPEGSRVRAGRQVRVYTGYGNSDGVSFFMNNDRAVWNNDGDEATLYDRLNTVVVRYVY